MKSKLKNKHFLVIYKNKCYCAVFFLTKTKMFLGLNCLGLSHMFKKRIRPLIVYTSRILFLTKQLSKSKLIYKKFKEFNIRIVGTNWFLYRNPESS